jgi:hypothetical protein
MKLGFFDGENLLGVGFISEPMSTLFVCPDCGEIWGREIVIMYKNIKPALSRNLLIQAIHMLEGQLESTEITNGNTLGKQEPPHVAHSFEKAS